MTPMSKENYAVVSKNDTGKVSVVTLSGKDVTKDVKSSSLDRAVSEKEKYMFLHPRTKQWTREIHLKSSMWKDIETYTGTGISVAPKTPTKAEKASPKPSVKPAAKPTAKVTPKSVATPSVAVPAA